MDTKGVRLGFTLNQSSRFICRTSQFEKRERLTPELFVGLIRTIVF